MSVENRMGDVNNTTQGEEQFTQTAPNAGAQPETRASSAAHTATHADPQVEANSANSADTTRRMLYRHPSDSVLGGVCGGLADYFGWDAALVRILWVVLTLATSGGGLLAYLALWILLPVGTTSNGLQRPATLELNERNLARAAWILIGFGAIWLLGNVGILPWLWGGFWRIVSIVFWPALLIAVGYVLLRYTGKTANWGTGFGSRANQVKSGMGERIPTSASMKSGFNQVRQKLPLKRSRNDRIWMGVCGGIGQRLGIDSNLVRLIWAAFSIGSIGMGVLIYVVAGLFLAEETPAEQLSTYDEETKDVQIINAPSERSV